MRREQREAAAARDLLQVAAMRERKLAAARGWKGATGPTRTPAAEAKRTTAARAKGTASVGAKGTAATGAWRTVPAPPSSEGIAGALESPASFYSSQFPSAANVDGSADGDVWNQGTGGSPNGHGWMRHQSFDPSTW